MRGEERSVGQKKPEREQTEETKQSRWGFRGKTVWDWLPIVGALLVPLVIALGTGWITRQLANLENQRAQQAQKVENQRAEAERELAEQRAQDEALQAYPDQMSGLLLEKDLRTSEEDSEVRTLARARALTVLERLDPSRKTAVVQFLVEAKLVQRVVGTGPIISLNGADLSGAYLFSSALSEADLDGARGVTNRELEQQACLLSRTTMPNGQKYEDWLKSKDQEENKKSDDSHDRREEGRTVTEAAWILGITEGAVRKRVERGKLASQHTRDGRLLVYLDRDTTATDTTRDRPRQSRDTSEGDDRYIRSLEEQVQYLRAQLEQEREARTEERRRQDTVIAQLSRANEEQARTIRELEAPASPEARESPQRVEEELERTEEPLSGAGDSQEGARRPWWRRIFGS